MSRSAVQSLIHTWRRTAVQSDLKFHTHVSQAASLGYCLSEDNSDAQHDFLHLRHKHLYVSMRLTRESVAQLTGPASDDLIDDIMRVAGNGANIKRSTFCEQVPRNIPHRWICAHQDFRALRPESLPSPGSPSLGGGTGRFGHGRSDGREPHTIAGPLRGVEQRCPTNVSFAQSSSPDLNLQGDRAGLESTRVSRQAWNRLAGSGIRLGLVLRD